MYPDLFYDSHLVDIYVLSNPSAFIDKTAMNNLVHLSFPEYGSIFVE